MTLRKDIHLFENLPAGVSITNKIGKIIDVNQALVDMLGYTNKTELLNIPSSKIYVEKGDRKKLLSDLKKGSVKNYTIKGLRKDGSILWLSLSTNPVYSENGDLEYISLIENITEQVNLKTEHSKREELFKLLSDSTFEAIFISHKGVCINQNGTAEKMFGYTLPEAIGKQNTDWIHPDYRNLNLKHIRLGYEKPYEVVALRKNGSTFPAEIKGRMSIFQEKKIWITTLRDISEEKLIQQEKEINEKRFKLVIEKGVDAIFITDLKGNIIEANQKALEGLGYSYNELLKLNVQKIALNYSSIKKINDLSESLIFDETKTITDVLKRKDGSLFPVEAKLNLIKLDNKILILAFIHDISERLKTEKKLKKSEEKYKAFVNGQIEFIYCWKPDGTRVFVNKAYADYYNKSINELTGTSFIQEISSDAWKLLRAKINKLTLEQPININEHKSFKNGEVIWKEWTDRALFNEKGDIYEIQSTGRDITKQKLAKEKLIENEIKFRTIFNSANDAILIFKENRFVDCNSKTLELFKCTKEQIIGKSSKYLFPEKQANSSYSAQKSQERIDAAISGKPQIFEWTHKKFDGTEFSSEISLTSMTLPDGIYIQAIIRDITERKKSEEAIINSEEQLKIIFDNSPDTYFLSDLKGNTINVNNQTEKMLGVPKKDILNKNFLELGFFSSMDFPKIVALMTDVSKGKSSGSIEIETLNSNGEKILSELRMFPVFIDKKMHLLGTARDITEKKIAEEELIASEKRYRALFEESSDPTLLIEDGVFIECNDATISFLQYKSKKEIEGKTPFELSPEFQPNGGTSKKRTKEMIDLAIKNGNNRFEWVHLNSNNEKRFVDVALTLIPDKKRKQIYTVWRDITIQRKTENKILKNEALLRATLEATGEGVLVVNNNGDVTHYNNILIKQWNLSSELVGKMNYKKLLNFAASQLINPEKFIQNVETLNKSTEINFNIIEFKDGRKYESNSYPLIIENTIKGRVTGFRDVTERYAVQEKLKESETKFKQLIENLPDAIFVSKLEGTERGKIIDINRAAEIQTGYSRDELIGKNIGIDLLMKFNKDLFLDNENQLLDGHLLRLTEQKKQKNGTSYWVEVLITTINHKGEKVALSVNRDMTELKKSEKALEENRQNLLLIYETAGVNLFHISVEQEGTYRIISANNTYLRNTGRKKEDVINKKIEDVFNKESVLIAKNNYKKAITLKKTVEWEETGNFKSKSKSWALKATPVFNEYDICTSIIEVAHDITEKQEIELKIIKSQEELEMQVQSRTKDLEKSRKAAINLLQDSNEQQKRAEKAYHQLEESHVEVLKLSQAIEQNPAAVVITDTNGFIEYVNQNFTESTGYLIDEIKGVNPIKIIIENSLRESRKDIWSQIMHGKTWKGELKNIRKNGNSFWESVSISPIFDEKNKIINYVKVGQDISERKKLEEDLLIAKELADEATKAKSEFLANMSHEIRTPMNAILGFADLLSINITDSQTKSYVQSLKTSGKSLLNLINDILDLSKVEAGMLHLNYEYISIKLLFEEIRQIFIIEKEEKKLDFILEIDNNLPVGIFLDEARLRQVLINLANNAIKFTNSGYIKLIARLEENLQLPANKNSYAINLIIEVEDTGIGIPKEFQEVIFESFTQQEGHDTKKHGGTGLGLAISQKLVKLMNGKLTLKSNKGKGSVFSIYLKNTMATSKPVIKEKTEQLNLNNISFKPSNILIVDDVQNNLIFLTGILEHAGQKVTSALNGEEAIQKIKIQKPDLIISDIRMPVMDGIELLKYIRKADDLKQIPVISASASVMKESLIKLYENDFDGFLTKPIQIPELLHELTKFLVYNKTEKIINIDKIREYNYTDISKEKILDIIKQTETELLPLWKQIKNRQPIKKVEYFGNALIKIGEQNNFNIFIDYGNDIIDTLESFNIEDMVRLIKQFPDILNKIKN